MTDDRRLPELLESVEGRRKPDFFVVGAPKAGTTALYMYLTQHPKVFMPEVKEPHFFYDREAPGSPVLGKGDLEGYLRLFEGIGEDVAAGEGSTTYLQLANAPGEIRRLQPRAKAVMILRDPVARAYSQYWNQVRDGREPLGFEEALRAEPERIRRGKWSGFYYVECGRYAEQVARYFETFGRESVKVFLFEDLNRDAAAVCRETFEFLGVDSDVPLEAGERYNRSGPPRSRLLARALGDPRVKAAVGRSVPPGLKRRAGEWLRNKNAKPVPEMDPRTRGMLREAFEEDVLRLEGMIGRDLSAWRGR